jgi:hypothetical protein
MRMNESLQLISSLITSSQLIGIWKFDAENA